MGEKIYICYSLLLEPGMVLGEKKAIFKISGMKS